MSFGPGLQLTCSEQERRETIAANRQLLAELGLNEGGAAALDLPKPKAKAKAKAAANPRKRKAPAAEVEPRATRRSGRIAGVKADPVQLEEFRAEEERAREAQRVADRRVRDQVMPVAEQLADDSAPVAELEALLRAMPLTERTDAKSVKDAYPDKTADAELQRLQAQFSGMHLAANKKVTTERVYTMLVHPDPTRNLVLVGDKYGQLGVWDAPTADSPRAKTEAEDEVKHEVKQGAGEGEEDEEEEEDGRVWRMQAHAKNSISCMKVDPVNGQSVSRRAGSERRTELTPRAAHHVVVRLHAAAARLCDGRVGRGLRVRRRGHARDALRPRAGRARGVARRQERRHLARRLARARARLEAPLGGAGGGARRQARRREREP